MGLGVSEEGPLCNLPLPTCGIWPVLVSTLMKLLERRTARDRGLLVQRILTFGYGVRRRE